GGAATSTTQKYFSGESLWKKVQGSTATYYLPSLRVENGQYRKYYGSFAERSPDGSLKYYHNDHLGSSVLVTDASGACVHSAAYMPYGSDRSGVVSCGTFTPPYQFNFMEKEQDGTSFYDHGARIYNPATARWLSADSSTKDGLNRYAYVSNNPLRYRDPTGHAADDAVEAWFDRMLERGLTKAFWFGVKEYFFIEGSIDAVSRLLNPNPEEVAFNNRQGHENVNN